MSFNVLVVPEDPTYNGYMLKPLVERMLAYCNKNNAKVVVLTNPSMKGYEHAIAQLPSVIEKYFYYDLILFLPDRDGNAGRISSLLTLEQVLNQGKNFFFACAAFEEIETWLLAGHSGKLGSPWQQIRNDVSVKENYFYPFLKEYGDEGAGNGRERLMKEALINYNGMLQKCPELNAFQERICNFISEG